MAPYRSIFHNLKTDKTWRRVDGRAIYDFQANIHKTKHPTAGVGGLIFKTGARDTPWFTSFGLWRFLNMG